MSMEMVFSSEFTDFVDLEQDMNGYSFKVILKNGEIYPAGSKLRAYNICPTSIRRLYKEIYPPLILSQYKRKFELLI